MSEIPSPEAHEKIPKGQTVLLGEPVFSGFEMWSGGYMVPVGAESWVRKVDEDQRPHDNVLRDEYAAIAHCLHEMGIDFRMIIAHKEFIDLPTLLGLNKYLGVRGLGMHPAIGSTTFPRDMMVTFGAKTYLSPDGNFELLNEDGVVSELGEGGRVLKTGNKVLVPKAQSFLDLDDYREDITKLSGEGFQFGLLPWPLFSDQDPFSDKSPKFTNDHLDRAAALIHGKGGDYLLLDSNYARARTIEGGEYFPQIRATCESLAITPVVVDRTENSIPYALNMEQFADGSVIMTGGDDPLAEIVGAIVGDDKVHTTEVPITHFPLLRKGGIRCLMLTTSDKILAQ